MSGGWREVWFAGEGGDDAEVGEEGALGVDGIYLGLLGFDFGLEDVGCVGLADVGELVDGGDGVEGELEQALAEDDGGLRGEGAVEGLVEVVADTEVLCFKADAIGGGLLAVDVAAKAELAAEDDGLGDEGALLAATVLAAADVFAGVDDGGVGREAGLGGPGRGSGG